MKTFSMIVMSCLLTGCAGTMLDGRVCTVATDVDAQQDVKTIVNSYVNPEDQQKADVYLKAAKLTATAICEAARARQAAK